jgi:hypothetical protein
LNGQHDDDDDENPDNVLRCHVGSVILVCFLSPLLLLLLVCHLVGMPCQLKAGGDEAISAARSAPMFVV